MIEELKQKAENKMNNVISHLQKDMNSINTGRANPSLLDSVKVESYGNLTPLSQISSISVMDSSTISVTIWDKANVKAAEKAIVSANLGFTPLVDGSNLKIPIPKLSEERRQDLIKLSKKYGENNKISIRNIRRDISDEFKKFSKDSSASKDDIHSFSEIIQKITDHYIETIDKVIEQKEKALTTI